jgi:hypothetical protein
MINKGNASVIWLPKGGGALHGIDEKSLLDSHTGTGKFAVPAALPPERSEIRPQQASGIQGGCHNAQ